MRYTEKQLGEIGHDVAIEAVYGGDRFGVLDMEMMLDGIDRPDLEKIREYAFTKAVQITPGIDPESIRKDIEGWVGPNIRCAGERIASFSVKAGDLDALSSLLQDTYRKSPKAWTRDVALEQRLYGVSQADIDRVIDRVHESLRGEEEGFSTARLARVLDYQLSGIETAEFHRVRVAHYAEDLDFEIFRIDSPEQWVRRIGDYLTVNGWQVGDSLKEALEGLSRNGGNTMRFHPLDMGLSMITSEKLAAEVRYTSGIDDNVVLARPVNLRGETYEWIGEWDGVVTLWNEYGSRTLDNVYDVMTVDRMRGSLIDIKASEGMKASESVAQGIVQDLGERVYSRDRVNEVIELPQVAVLGGREVRGFYANREFGAVGYGLVLEGGEMSVSMAANEFVAMLRRSDPGEVATIDMLLAQAAGEPPMALEEGLGEELPPEMTYILPQQVMARTNGGESVLLESANVDPLGGVTFTGKADGGKEYECRVTDLDGASLNRVVAGLMQDRQRMPQLKGNNPGIR